MSFCVYMLKSLGKKTVTYVGYTKNLKERLHKHNSGKGAKFTRGRKWTLVYKEKFKSKKIFHAFCTRKGGVSKGIFKSLNFGIGSKDSKNFVRKNFNIIKKKTKFFMPFVERKTIIENY